MTSHSSVLRQYLDIINEGPPPGIGPNAMPKSAPTAQQPDQDTFTKMLPSMGNKMIDQMAGLAPQLQKTLQDFTPGSPYYEKNVKGNPKLEKAAADAIAKAGQFSQDPNALSNYIADIKQRFNQAIAPNRDSGRSATSPEYDRAADQLGLPNINETQTPVAPNVQGMAPGTSKDLEGGEKVTLGADCSIQHIGYWGTYVFDKTGKFLKTISPRVGGMQQQTSPAGQPIQKSYDQGDVSIQQGPQGTTASYTMGQNTVTQQMKESKGLLEHIEEVENEGPLTSGDYFHIELAEDEGIETWVIAEWSESVLIEADAATLKLLEEHGVTFHDELTEAEYQGRKVPLGKRMPGDVKKSKVYVRKPNGKVVKVNFGDKKMKIKKSNPARRKSFRARHNCANPGPRWKARYWSCRAW